jgi:hypothetical protein
MSGCLITPVKDSSKFYALGIGSSLPKPPEELAQPKNYTALEEQPIKVDFRVISLPTYLRHAPLMVQISEHELHFDEFHRWAEPIEEGLKRIIVPRLYRATSVAHHQPQPSPLAPSDDASENSPQPSLFPQKVFRIKLSLEELKVDLSHQVVVAQGEITISLKEKGSTSLHALQEDSHRFALSKEIFDIVNQTISWERAIEALEGLIKELGDHVAHLCEYMLQE